MMIEDFMQLQSSGKIEPEASGGGDGLEPWLISIAVSLKRLADQGDKAKPSIFEQTFGR